MLKNILLTLMSTTFIGASFALFYPSSSLSLQVFILDLVLIFVTFGVTNVIYMILVYLVLGKSRVIKHNLLFYLLESTLLLILFAAIASLLREFPKELRFNEENGNLARGTLFSEFTILIYTYAVISLILLAFRNYLFPKESI